MSRTMRAQLGEICSAVYSPIYAMTPRQRSAALRALEQLTQTNCSWILYRMRPLLAGLIDDASSARERKARARARGET